MDRRKIIQSVVFLFISIGLFWWVYRDTDPGLLKEQLTHFHLSWIGVSIGLNVLSQWIRAQRWRLLFRPLPYRPKTYNLFLALLILAFTNQIIPRGGEIARLGVINRVEKVPFPKLLGMALAERLVDFMILLLIFIGLLATQFRLIGELLSLPEISMQNVNITGKLIGTAVILIIVAVVAFGIKKFRWYEKVRRKLQTIKSDILEGFSTLKRLDRKGIFFIESIAIYLVWLMMLYVLFFAFPPTEALSFRAAVFTFGLATLALLLPIQAGMGAWHFVVIQCLLLFGIDAETGKTFALVAHAATNLIFLLLGIIAFALLPLVNKTNSR